MVQAAVHLCIASPTFLLIFLSLVLQSVDSYFLIGYQLKDLTSNDELSFVQEISAWSVSLYRDRIKFTKHYNCAGTLLLGGYGILGSTSGGQWKQYFGRTYTGLPSHQTVRISFSLWMLDGWKQEYYLHYYVDDYLLAIDLNNTNTSFICGTSAPDIVDYKAYSQLAHNSDNLTLILLSQSMNRSTTSSFGIRDINILFYEHNDIDNIDWMCPQFNTSALWPYCTCQNGGYDNSTSGTCEQCTSGCKGCFDSRPTQCYLCEPGWYFDGKTCAGQCGNNCSTCHSLNTSECVQCNSGYVLFDGSCVRLCETVTDYLYQNGSCNSTCISPYISKTEGNTKFCRKGSAVNGLATVEKPRIIDTITESRSSSTGMIVGVCLGIVLILLAIAIYVFIKRKKVRQSQAQIAYTQKESRGSQQYLNSRSQAQNNYAPKLYMMPHKGSPITMHSIANEIIERPLSPLQMIKEEDFEERDLTAPTC